ncbi:GntR family transcriptional regulator [Caldalkalibacillus uzonensis]|uniref:GntR family transcriptional regulator n=1 Tax=Caldalkalibacillus uzonensis TaxID=353224 RepID=A0ABU0CYC4_9BACI|nr:GntR family transcriptional regulator [Caldalkalibacillus uzonensis]MDQ0341141.1 GntR family transcriptional regulator [Caldalkalibacillus uzonensis]
MRIPICIDPDSKEPLYHQIERQIKALIVGGQLPAGTPLPSIRALAADLSCSVITTRRAYQNLENEGLIKTSQGKGTFVSAVGDVQRLHMKNETVYEAFRQAVNTGLQLDLDITELRHIFEQVLQELANQKGE